MKTKVKPLNIFEGNPPRDGTELASRVEKVQGERPVFMTAEVLTPILVKENRRTRERA